MTDPFAWYKSALRGENPPIHDDHPNCGHFKTRRNQNSPWVAGSIWMDGEGNLICRVGDELKDPHDTWTWLAKRPVPQADAMHWYKHKRWPEQPDMAVSTIVVTSITKAMKSLKAEPEISELLTAIAERVYADTGKLPAGCEIKSLQECAA